MNHGKEPEGSRLPTYSIDLLSSLFGLAQLRIVAQKCLEIIRETDHPVR